MWCSSCQQDVPAVSSPEDTAGPCCARCRQVLGSRSSGAAASAQVLGAYETPGEGKYSPASLPPLPTEDWELETDLRSIERLVTSWRQEATFAPAEAAASPVWAAEPRESPPRGVSQRTTEPRQRGGFFVWTILSLGVMTFVCGGVLLAWSFAADRPDLRTLGLPLTLAGQAALIIGLVLQLEGLWHSNRQTRQALSELDGQLDELRHATTLITTSHSGPGRSFYAHMAEGASPHLLLADLKGQMDLLAQRMAAQQRQ